MWVLRRVVCGVGVWVWRRGGAAVWRAQKPESEQSDFEKALLNVEYDEDDTPSKLARVCKDKGNAMFKRGEEYYGNALRHYKVGG